MAEIKKVQSETSTEETDTKIPKKPVEVKNVSGRVLNLSMGQIDKNDIGWATPAEVGSLEPQYIQRV